MSQEYPCPALPQATLDAGPLRLSPTNDEMPTAFGKKLSLTDIATAATDDGGALPCLPSLRSTTAVSCPGRISDCLQTPAGRLQWVQATMTLYAGSDAPQALVAQPVLQRSPARLRCSPLFNPQRSVKAGMAGLRYALLLCASWLVSAAHAVYFGNCAV